MGYESLMAKAFAPASERNRQPILEVLRRILPSRGLVLEVASGTGQHAAYFARHMPSLRWQPTEMSVEARRSIAAWVEESGRDNLLPPLELDVCCAEWPLSHADAMLCINLIHICPWATTEALFLGAQNLLDPGAALITYGPYRLHGQHTAPSNAAFDRDLRSRNPSWGVRDIDELSELGARSGLSLEQRVDMPANNMTLVWRRTG
jgi:SAM-dependent methyltransferase